MRFSIQSKYFLSPSTGSKCVVANLRPFEASSTLLSSFLLNSSIASARSSGLPASTRSAIPSRNFQVAPSFGTAASTGITVHEFAKAAFSEVGLECDDFIEIENKYHRPTEVDALIGDYSKAEQILGWKPSIYAQNLAKLMVRSDLEKTKPGS